nr:S8 family serine peptidase [Halorhodospira abdelmalekii]
MEQYEPNDPGFDTEAEGGGARDWGYHAINAFEAWEVTLGSEDIKVAVIDGDFDPEHPEVAGPRVSGFNVTTGETNLEPEAGHSHGIHVAATAIGAIDNNEGVAGVCPRCSGLLIEASSGTQGMFAQTNIIDAMELARDRGADVINMSLGVIVPPDVDPDRVVRATRASERIYQRLIATMEEEGTVVVAAAGNDAVPARVDPRNRQDDSFVVGAVEHALAPASFTNYGDVVDIAAPGKAIYSAVAGGGYEKEEGTSMASPFVAGAVGLVRSVNPDLSPAEIRALLVDTAQPLEEDPDRPVGQLLDVAAAVEAAKPDDGVEPPGECDCPELERRVEELERRLEALEECCNGEPGDDDRLIIPGDPDEDDLTFAEGVWRASEGLTRDRDGVEIEIEFRISADGSGRIAYDEPEGECRADLTVTLEDRVLSMEHDEVATCQHDPATAYNPHQFECEALADGVAWCSAQSVVDPDRDVVRFFMEEQ